MAPATAEIASEDVVHDRKVAATAALTDRQLVGHLRHLKWNETNCNTWDPALGDALRKAALERKNEIDALDRELLRNLGLQRKDEAY